MKTLALVFAILCIGYSCKYLRPIGHLWLIYPFSAAWHYELTVRLSRNVKFDECKLVEIIFHTNGDRSEQHSVSNPWEWGEEDSNSVFRKDLYTDINIRDMTDLLVTSRGYGDQTFDVESIELLVAKPDFYDPDITVTSATWHVQPHSIQQRNVWTRFLQLRNNHFWINWSQITFQNWILRVINQVKLPGFLSQVSCKIWLNLFSLTIEVEKWAIWEQLRQRPMCTRVLIIMSK